MVSSEDFAGKAMGLIYKIRDNTDETIDDNLDYLQNIVEYASDMMAELEDEDDD